MDETATHSSDRRPLHLAGRGQLVGRLRRLVLKELREILRDRRTIITLVVMPILIYPLLAVVFQRFLVTSIATPEEVEYVIGVDSPATGSMLLRQIERGDAELARRREALSDQVSHDDRNSPGSSRGGNWQEPAGRAPPTLFFQQVANDEAERKVVDSSVHLVALYDLAPRTAQTEGLQMPRTWDLFYRSGSPTSEAALHYVESRLHAYNEISLNEELERLGVKAALPATTQRRPIRFSGAPIFSLAALIPLILVLMTVTGAVYPAIDLTAGERERGTLETLIAAPVPRLGLLMAKYVAVLTVALLTALVNLTAMTITAHSTSLGDTLFGAGLTFTVVVKVLLLLALFAAFFSAILLALTSYARSFKEAQAYIIPLMLVCLVPGVLCLLPGLEFDRVWSSKVGWP
jgi:ABC-type Na+ efflux pump permease subunit